MDAGMSSKGVLETTSRAVMCKILHGKGSKPGRALAVTYKRDKRETFVVVSIETIKPRRVHTRAVRSSYNSSLSRRRLEKYYVKIVPKNEKKKKKKKKKW